MESIRHFLKRIFFSKLEETMKGKRVLVTGGSTGIGEQLAYLYCKLGANLVVTARRQRELRQVVERCVDMGKEDGKYGYLPADCSNPYSSADVIEEAVKYLGGLDILVLNHCRPNSHSPWLTTDTNFHDLDEYLDVELKSYVRMATSAMPHLETTSGSIIVMTSLAGKFGIPYNAAHSATKSALEGFFTVLREEQNMKGKPPVSITLCPIGFVGTDNVIRRIRKEGRASVVEKLEPEEPVDAALAIVRGGALRDKEVFFPYWTVKPVCLLRNIVPEALEKKIQKLNKTNPLR